MLEKPIIKRNRSKSTYNKTTYYHKLIEHEIKLVIKIDLTQY